MHTIISELQEDRNVIIANKIIQFDVYVFLSKATYIFSFIKYSLINGEYWNFALCEIGQWKMQE